MKYIEGLQNVSHKVFKDLTVERFSEVNLIVGDNNTGKSTLLTYIHNREGVSSFAGSQTPREEILVHALNQVCKHQKEVIETLIGGEYQLGSGSGTRRLLYLALMLFETEYRAILLIDEIENGLHYSVYEKVWEMLFRFAVEFDIQIFVTTHSLCMVESFKRVALNDDYVEGIIVRLERNRNDDGKIVSTVFDKVIFPAF